MRFLIETYGINGNAIHHVKLADFEHFRKVMRQCGTVYRAARSRERARIIGPKNAPYPWINERETSRNK